MEYHPEQHSDWARLQLRKKINANYSKIGHDVYDLTLELLALRPSDDLLDIGCGFGDFAMKIRSYGHLGRLVAIEPGREMIEEARHHASDMKYMIDFRVANPENLDYPSGSFDCVTSLFTLERGETGKIISEMGRVIKGEGRVVVSTWSRSSFPLLEDLKIRAQDRFGWFLGSESAANCDSESVGEVLRRYFAKVDEFRYDDALQYPDAEVLVDLFRSARGTWNEKINEKEWDRIVDWAREQALELIPEHGYAEDPKVFSLFRCSVPLGM